jgi:hypothetical protein
MNENLETCTRLRHLHAHLLQEINLLKEGEIEEEREGVVNPLKTKTIITGLQKALDTIHLELQKCPGSVEI